MRLISLTCDQPSFKPIIFNQRGITLIVGDSSKEKEGSSNGAGKTLALGLVHHCLGANADKTLAAAVPDWWFSLYFLIDGHEHSVSRSGDGKRLLLDQRPIPLKKFRDWLDKSGVFHLEEDVPLISFRSLFKRFARYSREDCLSPTKTNKESDFDSLIRTLYLLGLDCTLATSKKNNKLDLDQIGQALKNWKRDEVLKEMFRAGAQPKLRSEWLGREIPRLEQDLSNYQIAEDYRALEVEAGNITKQIRILEKDKAIADFQLDSIEKTLLEHPDISREDLMELYAGLQEIFRPETLAHFDAVAQFHSSLSINRQKRLQNDKIRLIERKKKLDQEIGYQVELRDKKLQALQGKRALDEYAAIANQLAEFKQELERLNEFLNFSKKLQERAQEIREVRVEEDRAAANYAAANPIKGLDEKFKDLAEIMYPRVPAGMVISPNTGDNQLRFDFSVQIEGDDSDGINAAKIICFDWLVLNYGAHHNMDMLWHDNRLFADIDPGVRGRWFSFVHAELLKSGKQYIATLNTENYEAMKGAMSDDIKAEIEKSIVLTLRGDQPSNKLLGIQFGKALGR